MVIQALDAVLRCLDLEGVSTWLNTFKSADELRRMGREPYELTAAEKAKARNQGFVPIKP